MTAKIGWTDEENDTLVLCVIDAIKRGDTVKKGIKDFIDLTKTTRTFGAISFHANALKKRKEYRDLFSEIEHAFRRPRKNGKQGNTSQQVQSETPLRMSPDEFRDFLGRVEIVTQDVTQLQEQNVILTEKLDEARKLNVELMKENERLKRENAEVTEDRDNILSVFVRARELVEGVPSSKEVAVVVDKHQIVTEVVPK